jgi:hypothetical protein
MHDEWLVSEGALLRLLGAGLPKVLLQAYFNHPTTLLIGAKHPNALVPKASLAGDFTSAAALISALDEHRMATHEKYVVLDLEAWRMTPSEEQRQPIQAAQQALTGAHAVGVRLIFTPGTDLVRVLEGHALHGRALIEAYDRLLAGPGVKAADVFEIQAQATEGTPLVASFASSALAAAGVARSSEPVLVGLSTNPDGRTVTPADLLRLVRSVPHATGFWLNVPQAGTACPRCGRAHPQVGVTFLEELVDLGRRDPGASKAGPTGRAGPDRGLFGSKEKLLAAGNEPAAWRLAAAHFQAMVVRLG